VRSASVGHSRIRTGAVGSRSKPRTRLIRPSSIIRSRYFAPDVVAEPTLAVELIRTTKTCFVIASPPRGLVGQHFKRFTHRSRRLAYFSPSLKRQSDKLLEYVALISR
jgi:hypothetical protein